MRIKVLSGGRKSIELPLSDAELNFQMKRIGIEEIVPVCRLVEASEKDNPLCKFEGQTVKMDEVNFFAKRLDCFTEYERKVLYSYVTDYGVGTMQDLINLTFSMKGLSLITDFSDVEQVGKRLYLDEFIAIPEEEKQQTNFIKFAEKTFKETIKYEEEKLNAIKQYMGKKDADFESELNEVLGKMYEKYVPQAVREYIDSRGDVPAAIKKSNKNTARGTGASAGMSAQNE